MPQSITVLLTQLLITVSTAELENNAIPTAELEEKTKQY